MPPPTSSRSIDPRLASASGVMRDTVGAIRNLQHLLESVRVGPKALSRVIPDVHASSGPMIAAARDLVAATEGGPLSTPSVAELAQLISARMQELERALGRAKRSVIRASERLALETALSAVMKDLDGALPLVDLIAEGSATGSVPVDITDVVRESAVRPDSGASRGRRLQVTFDAPAEPIVVKVNPRLAMRLLAFAAALAANRDGVVHIGIQPKEGTCLLSFRRAKGGSAAVSIAAPPLIDLSARCAVEIGRTAGAVLTSEAGAATLALPLAATD